MAEGIGSSIGGAIGNLIGGIGSGSDAKRLARENMRRWLELQGPDFDYTQLPAPVLQYIGDLDPEFYNAVVMPKLETAARGETRGDQMKALDYLQNQAQKGFTADERLAAGQAQRGIAREALRGQEAIKRDLAGRGRLGGGAELVARMMGNQQVANMAGEAGTALAREALARRYGAQLQAGQLAGDIRGQDEALNTTNASMANRFNEIIANMRTQAAADKAAAANAAQARNLQTQQAITDQNAVNRYNALRENQNMVNANRQAEANFRLSRQAGVSDSNAALQRIANAQDEQRMQMAQGLGEAVGSIGDFAYSQYKKKPTARQSLGGGHSNYSSVGSIGI